MMRFTRATEGVYFGFHLVPLLQGRPQVESNSKDGVDE